MGTEDTDDGAGWTVSGGKGGDVAGLGHWGGLLSALGLGKAGTQ